MRETGINSWHGLCDTVTCSCYISICFLLLSLHGRAEEVQPLDEVPPLEKTKIQPHYEGRLRLEYDYRSQGGEEDSDVYGYWNASASDLDDGHYDIYISGRTHSDLDGNSSPDTFQSIDDAYGVTENRILQAYVDAHDRKGNLRLILGRQYIDVADYIQVDGGQLIVYEKGDIGGRIYAGMPVSYYSSVAGNFAGGASMVGRPWTGNRSRFTYSEYYDDDAGESDRNYLIDVQQKITEEIRTRTRSSVLNDSFRYASFDLFCTPPDYESNLRIGGSRWGDFDANTYVYSPLYAQFGDQQPYTYLYTQFDYSLGTKWMLSPGISTKINDGDKSDYSNRDYTDYQMTVIYEPIKPLSLSLSLEYWDVSDGDSFVGLSGDVRYRYLKLWEISAGTAYMDYTYNSYSDFSYSINNGQTVFHDDGTVTQESPYSITYFLRMKWNIKPWLILRLQGDLEDDTAEADLSYRCRGSVEVRL